MKLKNIAAKALVFTMALSTLPFTGISIAKAAAPTNVTFDGVKGVIKATNPTHWGIAVKEKKKPKKLSPNHLEKDGTYYKIKSIEPVVGGEVNLEKYKGKGIFVAIGGSSDLSKSADWVVKEIKEAEKVFKPVYTATNTKSKIIADPIKASGGDAGYLTFLTKQGQMELTDVATKVEVKAGSGNWTLAKDFFAANLAADGVNTKLSALIQRGAKLSFRLKGDENGWGSKEAKLNIPAQKNGPSVKLDFTKNVTNLKKSMEYKFVEEGAVAPTNDFAVATDKMPISSLTGLLNTGEGEGNLKPQDLYVRLKKTDKSMPTKLTKIKVKKIAKPALVSEAANITAQSANLIANEVYFELKVPYDKSQGAYVINKSIDKDYEFALSYDGTSNNLKWISLKRAKEADKPTRVQVKASKTPKAGAFNTDNNSPSKIFIRVPGVKQDSNNVVTLPSPSIESVIKPTNVEQAMTITTATSSDQSFTIASATAEAFTLKVAPKTEKTFTIAAKITNVVKKEGKIKLKVTKPVNNVKVTADELTPSETKDAKFNITISINENAFPTTTSGTLTFTLEHESVKKTYTVTFQPAG